MSLWSIRALYICTCTHDGHKRSIQQSPILHSAGEIGVCGAWSAAAGEASLPCGSQGRSHDTSEKSQQGGTYIPQLNIHIHVHVYCTVSACDVECICICTCNLYMCLYLFISVINFAWKCY